MLVVGYPWTKDVPHRVLYDMEFHIGAGRIRENVNEMFSVESELVVQADGHELEKIREQFSNIPMTTNRVVRWNGEMARFIIENLNL